MNCSPIYAAPLSQSPSIAATIVADCAKPLDVGQAISLYEGLTTMMDVLGALMCQPRFLGDRDTYNAAGEEMEDIWEALGLRLEGLVSVIRASRPNNDFYRRKRAAFLAAYEIQLDGDDADRITDAFMGSPA